MVFDKIDQSWHILASLLWIASKNDNGLEILDFGGGLGTSYFQNRNFLDHLKHLSWCIVEQDKFVKYGKESFEDDKLKFYYSVEEYGQTHKPDAVLLSSSLQYIEKPYDILDQIIKLNPKYIIIDKTPFLDSGKDLITVQKVPPHIYNASYPAWVFSYSDFLSFLKKNNYDLCTELDHYRKDIFSINDRISDWRGLLFKRI